MAKIRNFDSSGAVFPHFCPVKREIWHAPRAKFHVYRGKVSHFWTTEQKEYRHGCATRRPAGNYQFWQI